MSQTRYSENQILTSLLRDVSRSFYLTLRVLPVPVRPQIGLAYLLARTADTIADTELVPLERRLVALQSLLARIVSQNGQALDFGDLARHQGSSSERVLLEKCENSLSLLHALSAADRELVIAVLRTILSGQELDLRRFGHASSTNIVSLRSEADLDDYTYRVAGCVGEFWTRICRAHLFPAADLEDAFLLSNGVRFGKGLQLINILRDLAVDLQQGRCYLPSELLQAHRLRPQDLAQPSNEQLLRPIYNRYLDLAHAHLSAGWTYTNKLPRRAIRVRLACAWPLLIGRQTLRLLRQGPVLNPEIRPKVTRRDVKKILWRTLVFYPWPSRWEGLFEAVGNDH